MMTAAPAVLQKSTSSSSSGGPGSSGRFIISSMMDPVTRQLGSSSGRRMLPLLSEESGNMKMKEPAAAAGGGGGVAGAEVGASTSSSMRVMSVHEWDAPQQELVVVAVCKNGASCKGALQWAERKCLEMEGRVLCVLHVVTKVVAPSLGRELPQSRLNAQVKSEHREKKSLPMLQALVKAALKSSKVKVEYKVAFHDEVNKGVVLETIGLNASMLVMGSSWKRRRPRLFAACKKDLADLTSIHCVLQDGSVASHEAEIPAAAATTASPRASGVVSTAFSRSNSFSNAAQAQQLPRLLVASNTSEHSSISDDPDDDTCSVGSCSRDFSHLSLPSPGKFSAAGPPPSTLNAIYEGKPSRPLDSFQPSAPPLPPSFMLMGNGNSMGNNYHIAGHVSGVNNLQVGPQMLTGHQGQAAPPDFLSRSSTLTESPAMAPFLRSNSTIAEALLQMEGAENAGVMQQADMTTAMMMMMMMQGGVHGAMDPTGGPGASLPMRPPTPRGGGGMKPSALDVASLQASIAEIEAAIQKTKEAMQAKEAMEEASAAAEEEEEEGVERCCEVERLTSYSWNTVKEATSNFSSPICQGRVFSTFKARLSHVAVAVKIPHHHVIAELHSSAALNTPPPTPPSDLPLLFSEELSTLCQICHPHIIMLLGVCSERHCLVYEFMPGGTLEERLTASIRSSSSGGGEGSGTREAGGGGPDALPWYVRVRILAEVASALLALHSLPVPILHRDVKPSNVQLDGNLKAKLCPGVDGVSLRRHVGKGRAGSSSGSGSGGGGGCGMSRPVMRRTATFSEGDRVLAASSAAARVGGSSEQAHALLAASMQKLNRSGSDSRMSLSGGDSQGGELAAFAGNDVLQMGRLLMASSRGDKELSYLDPESQRKGDFTPASDVYSLGMLMLDVMTGKRRDLLEEVEDAVEAGDGGSLLPLLDRSAGQWPEGVALSVAAVALQCAELRRKGRPDLEGIMTVLNNAVERALEEEEKEKGGGDVPQEVPKSFFCPITEEIMKSPVVAADGYTYEEAAIKLWLERNEISPVTGAPLGTRALMQNYALRQAVEDWMATRSPKPC